jgi:hypothetical protein
VLKGNCLTVNTLDACLATWILKHMSVGEDAVGSYLVNILAPTVALRYVETVKCRLVANVNVRHSVVLNLWKRFLFLE